ncbi:MAG: LysM peptidoglycan-binding domain-containing protein [Bacillota bacterium]
MKEYIVQPGDTLQSIARMFDVPTGRLLSINPELEETGTLYVGQILQVPENGQVRRMIEVNAYSFPIYDPLQWSSVFPFLTYLSIFGHEIRPGGALILPDSEPLILAARQADVAPLMVVTNTVDGVYSGELLHGIFSDKQAQLTLIERSVEVAQEYGYFGVNFGFEYVLQEDYEAYASFLHLAANRLHSAGLIILASIRLVVVLNNQTAPLTEHLQLYNHILDRLIITPGDFVCLEGLTPIDVVQQGLDFVVQYISGPKILLGAPNCCYEWQAPYRPGQEYQVLSPNQADAIVRSAGVFPGTDPYTQMAVFEIGEDGTQRVILCNSQNSLLVLELVTTYNVGGISLRTLQLFNFASYQDIAIQYNIRKVLS